MITLDVNFVACKLDPATTLEQMKKLKTRAVCLKIATMTPWGNINVNQLNFK
jgi:hypothetical protein